MALIPLLKEGLVDPSQIVIDAKSGTTGAGRKAQENLLFSEVEGECLPYKIGTHQHLPEIIKYADLYSGQSTDIQFTTHLLPVRRGIISSIYLKRQPHYKDMPDVEFLKRMTTAFDQAYAKNSLVRFGSLEEFPKLLSLKSVVGSPRTHISYTVKGNKIFTFSCIDNLLKGAASQAIENWNSQNRWPTDTGLESIEGVL
jgi:N-acetyl-gamma-glutamyl-phosphate reductase